MAKSRKQEELDLAQERSIGTFQATVDNFSKVAERLADSFAGFAKTQELDRKAKKKVDTEKKAERGDQKKVANAVDQFENMFGKKTMRVAGKLMGKENFNGFKKGLAGIKGGGGTGGMLGKAAAGLGSAGGAILRAAGPAGMVLSGLKMAFDFWNSGGLAKLVAGVKMATNKGSMLGPGGIADMKGSLEGTEAFRKIDAKYAYQKPLELQQQLQREIFDHSKGIAMDKMAFEHSLVKDEVEYEMGLRKDALQFQLDQAKETLDAELEKRKAISASGISFIEKYATISERALKAIGSGTKQILEGVGKFTATFGLGIKQSFQLSENAQGLAYHLSGSDEDVMNMTKLFSLMGKTSAETAQNLIGGFESFAKINDIAPQVIFNQIKEAGEDIYKFSNGTADSFAKQAVLLSKMSVSMSSMMKASDTMVLNYKDSIKAEMSLSAMLGKNVNLSEVRAKLMAGDQAGGAAALKSALGGMDIGAMNPFAKQQLSQATGMDISALMALMEGKEDPKVAGELKAEAAKGKAFADAALNQDLANAGAKLALEQEQRKKLLEFEQRQRAAMMLLEQAQKMDLIKEEARYRAYWELKFAADMEKEDLAAQELADVASGALLMGAKSKSDMATAMAAYGLDASIGQGAETSNLVMQLLKEERIKSEDVGKLVLSFNDALEKNNVDMKDKAAVEATLGQVTQSTFGTQIADKNKDTDREIRRIQNLAQSFINEGGPILRDGGAYWKRQQAVSDKEFEMIKSLVGSQQVIIQQGRFKGQANTEYFVDQKKLEELRQANLVGYKSTVAATEENTEKTLELANNVATNGLSDVANQEEVKLKMDEAKNATITNGSQLFTQALTQEELDKKLQETGASQLTEAEFNSALQIETVSLLGLATTILTEIAINTQGLFEGTLNLDGKVISERLREEARRSYALGGNGRKTIGDFI